MKPYGHGIKNVIKIEHDVRVYASRFAMRADVFNDNQYYCGTGKIERLFRELREAMGKIEIDRERCKGCQLCVSVCPKKLIIVGTSFNQKGYATPMLVHEEMCTGCALCAEMCPDICIRVWR